MKTIELAKATASLAEYAREVSIERSRARQKTEGGISGQEMRRRLRLKRTARGR